VGSPQGDAESEGEVEGDLASQVYLERGCGCAVAR